MYGFFLVGFSRRSPITELIWSEVVTSWVLFLSHTTALRSENFIRRDEFTANDRGEL